MSTTITVQLSEEELLNALRKLPPAHLRRLLEQLPRESPLNAVPVPTSELRKWIGIIDVGGDALQDSERLYDE